MNIGDIKDTVQSILVAGTSVAIANFDNIETSLQIILLILAIIYNTIKILKERK